MVSSLPGPSNSTSTVATYDLVPQTLLQYDQLKVWTMGWWNLQRGGTFCSWSRSAIFSPPSNPPYFSVRYDEMVCFWAYSTDEMHMNECSIEAWVTAGMDTGDRFDYHTRAVPLSGFYHMPLPRICIPDGRSACFICLWCLFDDMEWRFCPSAALGTTYINWTVGTWRFRPMYDRLELWNTPNTWPTMAKSVGFRTRLLWYTTLDW